MRDVGFGGADRWSGTRGGRRWAASGTADAALVWAFGMLALLAAAFLVVNMPPYQNPDETNHFLRADNVSRGFLLGHRFGPDSIAAGGLAAPEISRSGAVFDWPKFFPERKVTLDMYERARAKFGEPPADALFANTAPYSPVFYAPSVAAVWIGKAGRMTVIQTLYLARALTALASGAAIALALALCIGAGANGAALTIFAVATLPMSLSLQSACSQDGLMFGTAALATAFLVRLRRAPDAADYVLLCVCLALLAVARAPYGGLALTLLFVRVRWPARLAGVAIVLLAGGAWAYAASHIVGIEHLPGRDPAAQIKLLLDPARDVSLIITTLQTAWPVILVSFIGQLGWLDVALPHWFIALAASGLVVAALTGWSLRAPLAWGIVLAVIGSVLAILVALYVAWTNVGRPVVDGVQGRYLLPLALLLAGLGTRLPAGWLGWTVRGVVLAIPIAGLAVTMRAVVLRYYLGA